MNPSDRTGVMLSPAEVSASQTGDCGESSKQSEGGRSDGCLARRSAVQFCSRTLVGVGSSGGGGVSARFAQTLVSTLRAEARWLWVLQNKGR